MLYGRTPSKYLADNQPEGLVTNIVTVVINQMLVCGVQSNAGFVRAKQWW